MANKPKLGSSLRKSVLAEKVTVAGGKQTENILQEPKASPIKPRTNNLKAKPAVTLVQKRVKASVTTTEKSSNHSQHVIAVLPLAQILNFHSEVNDLFLENLAISNTILNNYWQSLFNQMFLTGIN